MPKRRSARFLLLPILALVFLLGWLMYSLGDKKNSKKESQKPMQPVKPKIASQNDLEMGLVSELAEEQQETQKRQKNSI